MLYSQLSLQFTLMIIDTSTIELLEHYLHIRRIYNGIKAIPELSFTSKHLEHLLIDIATTIDKRVKDNVGYESVTHKRYPKRKEL